MSYFPKATQRKKISKKKFESILWDKYRQVEHEIHYEHDDDYDAPPVRLTLYYEVLSEPDEMGLEERHCGTWMSGEGWEFLPEFDFEKISSLAPAALPITEEDWGSERQIDAEEAFLYAVRRILPEDSLDKLGNYGLKATTEERVAYALELVTEVRNEAN